MSTAQLSLRRRRTMMRGSSTLSTILVGGGRVNLLIFVLQVLITSSYITTTTSYYATAYNSHLIPSPLRSNKSTTANTNINTSSKRPTNFLRWRNLQADNVTLTNDDYNSTTFDTNNNNDDEEGGGIYIKFNSIGLKFHPVTLPNNDITVGDGGDNDNEGDDIAATMFTSQQQTQQLMDEIKLVIETHLNNTFRETVGINGNVNTLDYTNGRFDHVLLDELQFVNVDLVSSANDNDNGDEGGGEGGGGELVRRELKANTGSLTTLLTGGTAYYSPSTDGQMPTSQDLQSLIINSIKMKTTVGQVINGIWTEKEGKVGSLLASMIQQQQLSSSQLLLSSSFTTNNINNNSVEEGGGNNIEGIIEGSSTRLDNVGVDGTYSPDYFLDLFDDVDSVTIVDVPEEIITTSQPTSSPSVKRVTNVPTYAPTKLNAVTYEPSVGTVTTDAPTTTSAAVIVTNEPSSGTVPGEEEYPTQVLTAKPTTSYEPTVPIIKDTIDDNENNNNEVEGDAEEDNDDTNNNNNDVGKVIASSAPTLNSVPDSGNSNSKKNIVLISTIVGLLVLLSILIVALFVYNKKRRRRKSGDDEVLMKGVPLSSNLTEEDYDDIHNSSSGEDNHSGGAPSPARTASSTLNIPWKDEDQYNDNMGMPIEDGEVGRDLESGNSKQGKLGRKDTEYDKMLANTMTVGTVAGVGVAAAAAGGSHDSLFRNKRALSSSSQRISDLDILAGAAATKEELIYDDIDEAMKLATIVINTAQSVDEDELAAIATRNQGLTTITDIEKDLAGRPQSCPPHLMTINNTNNNSSSRPSTPSILKKMHRSGNSNSRPTTPSINENNNSSMTSENNNSFASHDILNDINAAAAERKRIEEKEQVKSRKEGQRGRCTPINFRCITPSNLFAKDEEVNETEEEEDVNMIDDLDEEEEKDEEEMEKKAMSLLYPTEEMEKQWVEKLKSTTAPPIEPEEEVYEHHHHGILKAINEVARSTKSTQSSTGGAPLKPDSFVPVVRSPSPRTNVVSPSSIPPKRRSRVDPPGVITLEDNMEDPSELFAEFTRTRSTDTGDVFADMTVDGGGEVATRGGYVGCGSNILQHTKEMLPQRSLTCHDDTGGRRTPTQGMEKKRWNPFSSGISNNKQSGRYPYTNAISDDDETSDEEDEVNNVSKPWKAKWNTDPFTSNQCSTTLREVSPTIDNNVDGSNYDPDSDWDVSDAEVDIVEDHGEDAFEAKAPIQRMRDTKNNTADCGAIRIW